MIAQPTAYPISARRGFTVVELLVALALIVFVMAILSEAFGAAAANFRNLKAIGDQQEQLRSTATNLRRDLADANFESARQIADGLRTGSVDREEIAELRKRYEAIAADAADFDKQLEELEQKLVNPAEKRIIRRARGPLDGIRLAATTATGLLELLDPND